MSWRHFAPWKDKFGLCTCWLTLIKFECSSLNDVQFASSVSWTATDSQTEVLALKMLDIFHCCFSDCELKREVELALISSPRFLEAIWLLNSDWLGDSILNGDWLYFHMWRMLYAKLIGRIAFIHMWKYSTYRILFARFTAQNSCYIYKKTDLLQLLFPCTPLLTRSTRKANLLLFFWARTKATNKLAFPGKLSSCEQIYNLFVLLGEEMF